MEPKDMILRDHLALDRTVLANQRTLLSFLRTSLYLIVSAVALFNVKALEEVRYVGYLLTGLSVLVMLFGVWNYRKFKRKINAAYTGNQ